MAIRITCPGCKTSLTLDEKMRGKKVRCRECEKVLNIPAANGKPKKEAADDEAIQEERKVKAKTAAASDHDEDGDEEEDRPAKKKKKKKAGPGVMTGVLIGGSALFVLLLAGVGVWGYKLTQKERDPVPAAGPILMAKAEEPQKERSGTRIIIPSREEGNPAGPTKKGGIGIINSVRGAGYRTERKNELKNIGLSFNQFCDEYKGKERTKENFLIYIRTFGPIVDAVKDGYYQINFKAMPSSGSSIIAYERDIDNQGHLAVKGDGSVDYVSAQELKNALGTP